MTYYDTQSASCLKLQLSKTCDISSGCLSNEYRSTLSANSSSFKSLKHKLSNDIQLADVRQISQSHEFD